MIAASSPTRWRFCSTADSGTGGCTAAKGHAWGSSAPPASWANCSCGISAPGGLTAEIGLWISPDPGVVGKEWVGCMGYVLDRMMGELGIQRVEGPVAAGNEGPRSVFQFLGFEVEARLERWRELHGELVDYDLFALTPSRWDKAREGAVDRVGGWAPARQP